TENHHLVNIEAATLAALFVFGEAVDGEDALMPPAPQIDTCENSDKSEAGGYLSAGQRSEGSIPLQEICRARKWPRREAGPVEPTAIPSKSISSKTQRMEWETATNGPDLWGSGWRGKVGAVRLVAN